MFHFQATIAEACLDGTAGVLCASVAFYGVRSPFFLFVGNHKPVRVGYSSEAGGGIQGGRVIGETDKIAGYPISDAQTPENLAATIYEALGLPRDLMWHDFTGRPHTLYMGSPIAGLT